MAHDDAPRLVTAALTRLHHTIDLALLIGKHEDPHQSLIFRQHFVRTSADDHKLFDTVNNQNARTFLESHNVDSDKIDFICTIINSVSFSKNRGKTPDSLEGKIVQDADRLDAMGAIGIARTFAYGGKHGRPLEGGIEHFHEKLLLLKDEMNTQTARELAESRHAFLEEFLARFEEENNVEI